MKTDVQDFLDSLEGGVLHEALGSILSDVALSVRSNDGKEKLMSHLDPLGVKTFIGSWN